MASLMLHLPVLLLVFVRLTAFFVSAPFFSQRGVPNQFKVGLALFMAIISFGSVPLQGAVPLDLTFILHVIKEALVGVILGYICELIYVSVQVAGGMMDMQMGLAMANVIDPRTGAYVPLTGQFKNVLAMLYFLSINGHHMLIHGIISSYQAIPLDTMWAAFGSEQVMWMAVKVFREMFLSAFMMAIPIVVSLFLVDLSLGIIAKSVPQFNIFVVGLPIKLLASFLMLMVVMPAFLLTLSGLFEKMFRSFAEMMKLLGGTG
ncbi:flagellar type III secretion system protein FliR [Brevibacillus composti]|uniref:Flagellar biosynthetic protein FliR n=1 Tax=Brevibacillus composti TaxID=2796470 RepID=A0A7T5EP08_9BACL|nr:flagellar biosynthetic protein FliR [Brevibacillus composti]QQE76144.1 flagellar type III secretion system protein FliR [Brevibacillus composti]QUO43173.1 flagellar type III secretion system protein FliR [Brevibacillus composti]